MAATGTGLLDLHGIGPSGAARLLVEVGDITRFPDRNHFASWTGTAPIDASSGDHVRHRLSRGGNRQINRVLHIMATVQLRNATEGRAYYDRKKADGKSSNEAMRCLKRRLSDAVYRVMVDDLAKPRQRGRIREGNRATTLTPARPAHRRSGTYCAASAGAPRPSRRTPGPRSTSPTRLRRWYKSGAADGFNVMPPWADRGGFDVFVEEVVPILPPARAVPHRVHRIHPCASTMDSTDRRASTPPTRTAGRPPEYALLSVSAEPDGLTIETVDLDV